MQKSDGPIWQPVLVSRSLVQGARALRGAMTPAESLLWEQLRGQRLGGWRFRKQHPVGRFILDFYCPAARLAIELDGAQHDTPEGRARDLERDAWLAARTITVLRFSNVQVQRDLASCLEQIRHVLATL